MEHVAHEATVRMKNCEPIIRRRRFGGESLSGASPMLVRGKRNASGALDGSISVTKGFTCSSADRAASRDPNKQSAVHTEFGNIASQRKRRVPEPAVNRPRRRTDILHSRCGVGDSREAGTAHLIFGRDREISRHAKRKGKISHRSPCGSLDDASVEEDFVR